MIHEFDRVLTFAQASLYSTAEKLIWRDINIRSLGLAARLFQDIVESLLSRDAVKPGTHAVASLA
jgi:hypothetical protein